MKERQRMVKTKTQEQSEPLVVEHFAHMGVLTQTWYDTARRIFLGGNDTAMKATVASIALDARLSSETYRYAKDDAELKAHKTPATGFRIPVNLTGDTGPDGKGQRAAINGANVIFVNPVPLGTNRERWAGTLVAAMYRLLHSNDTELTNASLASNEVQAAKVEEMSNVFVPVSTNKVSGDRWAALLQAIPDLELDLSFFKVSVTNPSGALNLICFGWAEAIAAGKTTKEQAEFKGHTKYRVNSTKDANLDSDGFSIVYVQRENTVKPVKAKALCLACALKGVASGLVRMPEKPAKASTETDDKTETPSIPEDAVAQQNEQDARENVA